MTLVTPACSKSHGAEQEGERRDQNLRHAAGAARRRAPPAPRARADSRSRIKNDTSTAASVIAATCRSVPTTTSTASRRRARAESTDTGTALRPTLRQPFRQVLRRPPCRRSIARRTAKQQQRGIRRRRQGQDAQGRVRSRTKDPPGDQRERRVRGAQAGHVDHRDGRKSDEDVDRRRRGHGDEQGARQIPLRPAHLFRRSCPARRSQGTRRR